MIWQSTADCGISRGRMYYFHLLSDWQFWRRRTESADILFGKKREKAVCRGGRRLCCKYLYLQRAARWLMCAGWIIPIKELRCLPYSIFFIFIASAPPLQDSVYFHGTLTVCLLFCFSPFTMADGEEGRNGAIFFIRDICSSCTEYRDSSFVCIKCSDERLFLADMECLWYNSGSYYTAPQRSGVRIPPEASCPKGMI